MSGGKVVTSLVGQQMETMVRVHYREALDSKEWDHAVACSTTHIRRLNLWSANLGDVTIKGFALRSAEKEWKERLLRCSLGAGYDVEPNNSTVVKGMNAGRLLYEPMHGGYGAVIALGQNYSLQGLLLKWDWLTTVWYSLWCASKLTGKFLGDIATELSDVILAQTFQVNEAVNLTVGNRTCQAIPLAQFVFVLCTLQIDANCTFCLFIILLLFFFFL